MFGSLHKCLSNYYLDNIDLEREHTVEYSSFWDSIRISFGNGDKIIIFRNREKAGICRIYSAEWDEWRYMSGKRAWDFIERVRKTIKHDLLDF